MKIDRASDFFARGTVVTDAQHDSPASGAEAPEANIERVLAYHRLSQHHPHRYAPSPGHLDWANQPDPFRTFAGAPVVDLPLLADALPASYGDLYVPGRIAPRRVDV